MRYRDNPGGHLGDLMAFATTFNEPNVLMLLRWLPVSEIPLLTTSG